MKVGIPRALLYYRYGRFWEEFLTGLGVEPVVTGKTDKLLLQNGLGLVPSEVCLPIKIVAGHLAALRDRVDMVFFPRVNWLSDRLYACPKMIGVVDIARFILGTRVRLIAPSIKGNFLWAHFRAGLEIVANPFLVIRALNRARPFLSGASGIPELRPGEKRIGLIGHFYNIEDDYVASPVVATFMSHGYRVITKEELPGAVLHSREDFAHNIRWVYERELYNAFRFLLNRVDGICVIVSMGCGPDSLVAEFMRDEARAAGVPFLQLVIDEHTGTAGLVTRIEAFLELAERQRCRTGPA
ncbi:MAG: acyl-CoA dehydratase activase-related protein [candidate division WOR-3 bacterium]